VNNRGRYNNLFKVIGGEGYSYRNEPELEQSHDHNAHKGFCEIEIGENLKMAKASYFNLSST
jgi:hypothetical protein